MPYQDVFFKLFLIGVGLYIVNGPLAQKIENWVLQIINILAFVLVVFWLWPIAINISHSH